MSREEICSSMVPKIIFCSMNVSNDRNSNTFVISSLTNFCVNLSDPFNECFRGIILSALMGKSNTNAANGDVISET